LDCKYLDSYPRNVRSALFARLAEDIPNNTIRCIRTYDASERYLTNANPHVRRTTVPAARSWYRQNHVWYIIHVKSQSMTNEKDSPFPCVSRAGMTRCDTICDHAFLVDYSRPRKHYLPCRSRSPEGCPRRGVYPNTDRKT
jgi:hypothetical protein